MALRTEYFILVVSAFVVFLAFIASYHMVRARKAGKVSWDTLVDRLVGVDRNSIATIAEDSEFTIDRTRIASMIGGMRGLEDLEANCEVLIDLACYVQRWYPEAVVVAEDLRLNARELKWHIARLRGSASAENLQVNFPDYAHRTITIYYEMTRSLLQLYERANYPGFMKLQRAI